MIRFFGKVYPIRKLLFFFGEGLFLFCSMIVVSSLLSPEEVPSVFDPAFLVRVLFIDFVCLLSLYYFDLYTFRMGLANSDMFLRLSQALGCASILLGALFFLFPVLLPGRWVFLSGLGLFFGLSIFWRLLYGFIIKKGLLARPVLILGSGKFLHDILEAVRKNRDCGFSVAGLVLENLESEVPSGHPVSFGFSGLRHKVLEAGAECIIVAMDEMRGRLPVRELLDCKVHGIEVLDGETFFEEMTGRILVDKINPSWIIFREGFDQSPFRLAVKRLVGVMFAVVGFVVFGPVLLITPFLIRLDSPGPILFRQTRVGKNGRPFTLVKFRSMRTDAEKDGAKWAKKDDDRVTRVGRFIRKTRIDELPQMWNVLAGHMGFVGPRPERPEFVDALAAEIPYYDQRHAVPPGITGWAQINYPYGASVEDAKKKLEYDLYYVKHMSVVFDLYIILKTIKTILFREGSR